MENGEGTYFKHQSPKPPSIERVTKQTKQPRKIKKNNKTWPSQTLFCCALLDPPPPNFHRLQQRWTQGAIDLHDRAGSFMGLRSYRQSLTIMHSPYVCLNKYQMPWKQVTFVWGRTLTYCSKNDIPQLPNFWKLTNPTPTISNPLSFLKNHSFCS